MRLNILMITREYPPFTVGGVAIHTYHLVKHLRKKGVKVTVVSFGDPSKSDEDTIFVKPESSIISRENKSILEDAKIPIDIARLTKKIKILLEKNNYDLIHVQEPYVAGHIPYNDRKITTIHDTSFGEIRGIIRSGLEPHNLKRTIFFIAMGYPMEFMSIVTSKYIIAPSRDVGYELLKIYRVPRRKLRIIYNGVEEPSPDEPNKSEARKILGIPEDKILVFTTAQHVARKRLELLIDATKILADRNINNIIIAIGGKGPLTQSLKERAYSLGVEDKIVFLGWIDRETLTLYYNAADIFVVTSDYEAGPITLLEAGIRRKTLISSRIGGFASMLREGIDVLLFEPGNPHDLAEKLIQAISDEDLRARLGRNAARFASRFTWSKVAEETIKLYKECIGGAGK